MRRSSRQQLATSAPTRLALGRVTFAQQIAVGGAGAPPVTPAPIDTGLVALMQADLQPLDALLTALAALVTSADQLLYFTGADAPALSTLTAFARTLLDDTTQAAMRTTLGLVPGTDVQAYDAELAALAGLASAADRLPYFTGSGLAALATFTSFARTLLDDADAATARATLGVSASGLTWTEVTGTTQSMSVNNGYIANNAGLVTLTLPATAALGDVVEVLGKGAGGWRVGQNSGQTIHDGYTGTSTTTGTGGYMDSTNQYASIRVRCITADTDWDVE